MSSKLALRSYFIATFIFVFFAFEAMSQTAVPPAAGSGSSANPLQISTIENLYWLSQNPTFWTRYFVQTNDINAAETEHWDGGKGFTPIGTEANRFRGSYDGAGYVIDSLYINRPDSDYVGLFGFNYNGNLSNHYVESLGITKAVITGKRYVGVLAGQVVGRVRNCYATGQITSTEYPTGNVGGLIGQLQGILDMSFSLTDIQADGNIVGGLVGRNYGTIRFSYAHGSVSGRAFIGGLVGFNYRIVENCYSVGALTGEHRVGGLIGISSYNSFNVEVSGVYDIETSGVSESSGGEGKTTAEMHNILTFLRADWDFLNESINGTDDIWGINDTINNGYPFLAWQGYESEELPECFAPLKPVSKIKFAPINTEFIEIFGVNAPNYSSGDGYAIFINSTSEFSTPSDGDVFYANPEFNNWGEQCIYFGDDSNPNVTVTNLSPGKYYFKLFAYNYCEGNRLYEQQGKPDSMIISPAYKIPKGDGSIDKPYVIANIENLTWLMISDTVWNKNFIQTNHIDASVFNGWPDDVSYRPIGSLKTPFKGNYNGQGFEIQNLRINLPDSAGVGLFGRIEEGEISNLGVTNVDIYGNRLVGGLVGHSIDGIIQNCYSTGECVADSKEQWAGLGGLVGNNNGTISQSFSRVNSYTPNRDNGGLVGANRGKIDNCFATGSVEASATAGGLIGQNYGSVSNSYATGTVEATQYIGGFVGYENTGSNIQNCFWDTISSGIGTSPAGTGKSTMEMKDPVLFIKAGWDFEGETINGSKDYWTIRSCVNEGYPHLRKIGDKEAPQIISSHPDEHYDGSANCDLELKDYRGLVKANDNCTATGNIVIQQDPVPGTFFQNEQLVTLSAIDENKNIARVHFIVTLEDISAPIPDQNILPLVESECMVNDLDVPTATDICEGRILGVPDVSLPILEQGTTIITWTYEDEKGNFVTQTQNVVISDETAPVADEITLSDVTAVCEVSSLTVPTAMDNCAGQITGTHDVELPITAQGTTAVTWTYDDGNGNTSTQTQNVIIADVTAPVADVTTLTDITAECEVSALTAPTATDNCAGQITGTHDVELPISAQGTTVVTWTYDDGNGNTSTQTQNVIIDDVTAPVADVTTLTDITAECEVSALTAPTATDNCSGQITGTHDVELPISAQGTTVVIWTYDDGNGNTSTQTQIVIIADVTAPVAEVATLTDITAECEVATLTAPTATDNCSGQITGTHDVELPISAQGTTVVTWTYDDGNGNISTQTQNVVIDDVTAPVADVATLTEITAECEVSTLTAPTAMDNCTGQITGTHDVELPISAQGTTVVTWTYDDGNGNISTQTQNVVISDETAPIADVATLSDITAECEVSTLTAPTATDNCSGQITGTHDAELPISAQGTTVVTWTYDDGNGNTSTQTQNVVISDETAPIADVATLSDITAECEVSTLTAPTATDNCVGQITGTHDAELPITAQGTTVVTWAYDDGNGNTSTQTQNVVIDDVTAPTVYCVDNETIELAEDETQFVVSGAAFDASAEDNCNLSAIENDINNTNSIDGEVFAPGVHIISWVAIDENGNESTCEFTLTVNEFSGVDVAVNQFVQIYPNPAKGRFIIEGAEGYEIIVTDVSGKHILMDQITAKQHELELNNGIYFIHFKAGREVFTQKVIINE